MVKKSKEEVMQEIDNMTEKEIWSYTDGERAQFYCVAYMIADWLSMLIYTFLALNGWIKLKQLLFSPENILCYNVRQVIVYIFSLAVCLGGSKTELRTSSDLLKHRNIHLRKNNAIFYSYLVFDAISLILHLMPFSFAVVNAALMILAHTITTRNYERDPNKKAPYTAYLFLINSAFPAIIISFFCNSILSDLVNGLESAVNAIAFFVGLIVFFPLIMILLLFF